MSPTSWLVMAAAIAMAGCGPGEEGPPRLPVSGTVKWNGEPLKAGRIQFQPSGHGGPAGASGIVDGSYAIPRAEGLVPGKYQVMVYGLAGEAPSSSAPPGLPGDAPPPKMAVKDPIPEKYNARSQLTADVTKDGPNQFQFELTEK